MIKRPPPTLPKPGMDMGAILGPKKTSALVTSMYNINLQIIQTIAAATSILSHWSSFLINCGTLWILFPNSMSAILQTRAAMMMMGKLL